MNPIQNVRSRTLIFLIQRNELHFKALNNSEFHDLNTFLNKILEFVIFYHSMPSLFHTFFL